MRVCAMIAALTVVSGTEPTAAHAQARAAHFAQLPLGFEENRGQSDPSVRYLARGPGYTVFLTESETVLVLRGETGDGRSEARSQKPEARSL
jgi:hypothetical protein